MHLPNAVNDKFIDFASSKRSPVALDFFTLFFKIIFICYKIFFNIKKNLLIIIKTFLNLLNQLNIM